MSLQFATQAHYHRRFSRRVLSDWCKEVISILPTYSSSSVRDYFLVSGHYSLQNSLPVISKVAIRPNSCKLDLAISIKTWKGKSIHTPPFIPSLYI